MSDKIPPYSRGRQILRTLYEHGPLSNQGLRCILEPSITKCGVRQALALLKYKGFVVPRFSGIPANCGNFYQLSLSEENRSDIAKLIYVDPNLLTEPFVHDPELLHSQDCAMWCTRFKRMFPDAEVVREFHYKHNEIMKSVISIDRDDYHLKPDILMLFPGKDEYTSTTIAIEIERSRKSSIRIAEKLRKLACATQLDGVIYICSTDTIANVIRRIYETNVRAKAPRINHYGNNFVLFSTGQWSAEHTGPLMLNSELKPVPLFDWVNFLVTSDRFSRMEANRKLSANL